MRMHDKDWYAVMCRPLAVKADGLAGLQKLAADLTIKWKSAEQFEKSNLVEFEFVSSRRYFIMTDVDAALEEYLELDDTPRLIRRGRNIRFGYPGYVASVTTGRLRGVVIVTLPYAGLAREFWNEGVSVKGAANVGFSRVKIDGLLRSMQSHKSSTANLQLKLGRALVHNDPNARVITVRGQNVLDSDVYQLLFGKQHRTGQLTFDDTYARVGFYPVEGRSMTVFLDRYGNVRARPGVGGSNLPRLCQMLDQLTMLGLTEEVTTAPTRRLYLEDEV